MPDITMCQNEKCSRKERCYRYTAKPSEHSQSYFMGKLEDPLGCGYFWEEEECNK